MRFYVIRSENKECYYCRVGKGYWEQQRTVIDEQTWNGADFFIPRGMHAEILVSERFCEIADRSSFTNLGWITAERFVKDSNLYGFWYLNDLG